MSHHVATFCNYGTVVQQNLGQSMVGGTVTGSRYLSSQSASGRVPVKLFPSRVRTSRLVRLAISKGIVPDMLFPANLKAG
jgi:hypothetical protein